MEDKLNKMETKKSIYESLFDWSKAKPGQYAEAVRKNLIEKISQIYGWPNPNNYDDIKFLQKLRIGDTVCIEPISSRCKNNCNGKLVRGMVVSNGKNAIRIHTNVGRFNLGKHLLNYSFRLHNSRMVLTEKTNKKLNKRYGLCWIPG